MFDPHCLELAELFLSDRVGVTEKHKSDLAQHIQREIESWIDFEELKERHVATRKEPV